MCFGVGEAAGNKKSYFSVACCLRCVVNACLPVCLLPLVFNEVIKTLDLVGRAYIIHDGSVLTHGTTHEIVNNEDVRRVYLGDEFKI